MIEAIALRRAIVARLTNDSEIGEAGIAVFWEIGRPAPASGELYVVASLASGGSDLNSLGSCRILTDPMYLIRAIRFDGPADDDQQDLANRIDTLFHGWRETEDDPRFVCERQGVVDITQRNAGSGLDSIMGAFYRFSTTPD